MNANHDITPLISVIVPIYRVEAFLPRCIASITAQTFRNLEIILVDDGSDDNCPDICDKAAQSDNRINVIHQKNQGLSAARNAGIEAARGQYISFIDGDDFIANTMLADMYEHICKDNADIAICNLRYVDEYGNDIERRNAASPIIADEVLDRNQALSKLCIEKSWYYVVACNKLYARHIFDNIRFPVDKRNEDVFIIHEAFWAAERITVLKKALYCYVQRAGSIMNAKPTAKNLDEAEGWLECCKFALNHGLDELAICKYNNAISAIAEYMSILDCNDDYVRATLDANVKRAKALMKSIMSVHGYASDKIKAIMFAISPGLYRKVKRFAYKITRGKTK